MKQTNNFAALAHIKNLSALSRLIQAKTQQKQDEAQLFEAAEKLFGEALDIARQGNNQIIIGRFLSLHGAWRMAMGVDLVLTMVS
jgi:hypothetical protein